MTAVVLDGRSLAADFLRELGGGARELEAATRRRPSLGLVCTGDNPAFESYAKSIQSSCHRAGFGFERFPIHDQIGLDHVLSVIDQLNRDPRLSGILVQMPLPAGIPFEPVAMAIDPAKDIDGVHPLNVGRVAMGLEGFAPATPSAGMEILRRSGIELAGRRAVVIGRSNVVGRPLAAMLLAADATVDVCHSRTIDLASHTRVADVVACATGRAHLVRGDMLKPGAVVLDFGTNQLDGRMVGDVDFESARNVAGAITPVPGGIGPVTACALLRNALIAARRLSGLPA